MLDTVQASLHHTNGYAYFFKGTHYMKWKPGSGVVPLSSTGERLRRLGVDGWTSLPDNFKTGIDAAFYYPSRDAVYFFKGHEYVKWQNGAVPLNGDAVRRIGVDGWTSLPAAYRSGFDAVVYHMEKLERRA